MGACAAIRELLSAYLDGELTQQDGQKVAVHLEDCPACREVYEDFRRLRADIKRLEWPGPDETQWSRLMAGLTFKVTRGLGWLLWVGGLVILAAYGAYEFLRDFSFRSVERVGVLALILGLVVLLWTVLAERIAALPKDRYKDIEK